MKFRKKPVVIEAIKTSEIVKNFHTHNWQSLPEWIKIAHENGNIAFTVERIIIRTLEGIHRAEPDDMIIRGIKGELYICKPDIFKETYEVVESEVRCE